MPDSELEIFCRQVRTRSQENKEALALLHRNALTGNVMGVLRQELDSMVRCIFLRSVTDRQYRQRLLEDSVSGKSWRTALRRGLEEQSWQDLLAYGLQTGRESGYTEADVPGIVKARRKITAAERR
jgi:hypothetical protein